MPRARSRSSPRRAARRARLGDELVAVSGSFASCCSASPEVHAERNKPGLRAVVQVAFDATQLRLGRLDGAGATLSQLLDARLACSAPHHSARTDDEREHRDRPHRPERPEARGRPHTDQEQPDEDRLAGELSEGAARLGRPPRRTDDEPRGQPDPCRPERAAAARRPKNEDEEIAEQDGPRRSARAVLRSRKIMAALSVMHPRPQG